MTDSPSPAGRNGAGRFGPGNSGRPVGAQGRASARISLGILKHFERNSEVFLDRLLACHTPAYAGLLGRMVPRDGDAAPSAVDEASDRDVRTKLSGIRAAVAGGGDARDLLREVEALLYAPATAPAP